MTIGILNIFIEMSTVAQFENQWDVSFPIKSTLLGFSEHVQAVYSLLAIYAIIVFHEYL